MLPLRDKDLLWGSQEVPQICSTGENLDSGSDTWCGSIWPGRKSEAQEQRGWHSEARRRSLRSSSLFRHCLSENPGRFCTHRQGACFTGNSQGSNPRRSLERQYIHRLTNSSANMPCCLRKEARSPAPGCTLSGGPRSLSSR